ncbi:carbohydrate ABC transporter permease [Niallia sp. Sow4_A1]|uniref:carbohydrate ABC transporter permease n=1 Tax=Bacillaceae TaxID=186817 RepID=UPI0004E1BBEC|nr:MULTISPECIES: carbohydrate ABC transporter permease [Bacillaceae]MCF2649176.1 carbohydrate ABC transporter permease [Niallia circulans]SLL19389.1 carbohydrate ABC transporter membrane protein 2, CUT1 family [Mycobacteroides abscessus subsp. abscessus]
MRKTTFQKLLTYVGVIAVLVFTLTPVILLVIATFSSNGDLNARTFHIWPEKWTLENYINVFSGSASDGSIPPFLTAMKNSLIISLSSTILTLFIGIFAAYAYARFRFKGKEPMLLSVLGFRMVPEVVLLIPLYVIFARMGMTNKKITLIFMYTAFNLPFVIWMLQSYFRSIPKAMEEAAFIDGDSHLGVLFKFIIPISLPGIIAAGIFVMLMTWDEFMFASIFTSSYDAKTITVAISEFSKRGMIDFGMQITGGLLASIPPIILALFFQKYIISGLSEGADKG